MDAEFPFMADNGTSEKNKKFFQLNPDMPKHMRDFFLRGIGVLQRDGLPVFLRCVLFYIIHGAEYFISKPCASSLEDYMKWIRKHESHDPEYVKKEVNGFVFRPKITVLLTAEGIGQEHPGKSIEAVWGQLYPHWELLFCCNESTIGSVPTELRDGAGDSRIKHAASINEVPKLATGEFIVPLDGCDILSPLALFEIVRALNSCPGAKFLYSDEDRIDERGQRSVPFFKPGWSPDLFLSYPYVNHLCVLEKKLLEKIGGFRKGFAGSVAYDLLLRFTEMLHESQIVHIPKILCHRRHVPESQAEAETAREKEECRKALSDALERRNISGIVTDGLTPLSFRIKRKITGNPKVSIVIPTKDSLSFIRGCVDSILEKSTYSNYEIIIVDNNSSDPETLEYLKTAPARVLRFDEKFNFSRINNFAVKHAQGEYILFLNNDTEVITPDWIESMLEHAQRPEVGAVGCKLLYRNGNIQHAGVVLGMSPNPATGVAGHVFTNFAHDDPGYFGFIDVVRNYSAVTAAAMMMRKPVFEQCGGFDEALSVDFNDVDLCLRLREKGFLTVYTPFAQLYHFESASRGHRRAGRIEAQLMIKRWRTVIKNDHYYSPHLTLWRANCEIRI
jgi:O-antigen biosynthesis protein